MQQAPGRALEVAPEQRPVGREEAVALRGEPAGGREQREVVAVQQRQHGRQPGPCQEGREGAEQEGRQEAQEGRGEGQGREDGPLLLLEVRGRQPEQHKLLGRLGLLVGPLGQQRLSPLLAGREASSQCLGQGHGQQRQVQRVHRRCREEHRHGLPARGRPGHRREVRGHQLPQPAQHQL